MYKRRSKMLSRSVFVNIRHQSSGKDEYFAANHRLITHHTTNQHSDKTLTLALCLAGSPTKLALH